MKISKIAIKLLLIQSVLADVDQPDDYEFQKKIQADADSLFSAPMPKPEVDNSEDGQNQQIESLAVKNYQSEERQEEQADTVPPPPPRKPKAEDIEDDLQAKVLSKTIEKIQAKAAEPVTQERGLLE